MVVALFLVALLNRGGEEELVSPIVIPSRDSEEEVIQPTPYDRNYRMRPEGYEWATVDGLLELVPIDSESETPTPTPTSTPTPTPTAYGGICTRRI